MGSVEPRMMWNFNAISPGAITSIPSGTEYGCNEKGRIQNQGITARVLVSNLDLNVSGWRGASQTTGLADPVCVVSAKIPLDT